MSIRTIENLNNHLDSDIAWRKKEISFLNGYVSDCTKDWKRTIILRCAIPILYAHWEGFVKSAGGAYLEYVSHKNLKFCELADNLIALGIKSKLSSAAESKKATVHTEITRFFFDELESRCKLPYKNVIDTKSNLKSERLEQIACVLGIDFEIYKIKGNLIDSSLVGRRNIIAHGGNELVDINGWAEVHSFVTEHLELFRNQISNAAEQELYRRKP